MDEKETSDGSERPRGILSAADRRFLRDPSEQKSSAARSQRRKAVRERVHASLRDFVILLRHLPDEQREQIFREEGVGEKINIGVRNSAIEGLAFLYLGLGDITERDKDGQFANAIEKAIGAAHASRGDALESVNVSIEVEHGGALGDQYDLDELSAAELEQRIRMDLIDPKDLVEAIKSRE